MAIRRKAFTLVELLVVILILGVLAGLVIVGLGVLGRPAKEKDTRQTLQNLRNVLEELRTSTNLLNFYPNDTTENAWPSPMPAPTAKVHDLSKDPSTWNAELQEAIGNTRMLLHKLRQNPKNRDALNNLPAAQQWKLGAIPGRPSSGPFAESTDVQRLAEETPVILDGWGAPILIAPAEGLTGVTQGGKTYTVTTVKMRSHDNDKPAPADAPLPGARPFFVSAGPDGDFTTGDDNLYSFED